MPELIDEGHIYLAEPPLYRTDDPNAFRRGRLIMLKVRSYEAYVIAPTGKVDPARRWVWLAAASHGIPIRQPSDASDEKPQYKVDYQVIVDSALSKGFHVAGVLCGPTLGSPAGAELFDEFYRKLTKDYKLNPKARLLGQSNGGLMQYGWAFRHPECVERIGGIFPVTDLASWPGLDKAVGPDSPAGPGLGYDISRLELESRLAEFNPIDNLAPLAKSGVKIFHAHGCEDRTVSMMQNSDLLVRKYRALGGKADLEVLHGVDHSPGPQFYESRKLIDFLLE